MNKLDKLEPYAFMVAGLCGMFVGAIGMLYRVDTWAMALSFGAGAFVFVAGINDSYANRRKRI